MFVLSSQSITEESLLSKKEELTNRLWYRTKGHEEIELDLTISTENEIRNGQEIPRLAEKVVNLSTVPLHYYKISDM